ncbi:hypothetical protein ACOMHN_017750 [Nucella lapillus]
MLQSGLFNCSGDGYSSVRYHLDCNMKPECEDGLDETEHCPFSSPGCQGMVASRNKCFKFIRLSFRVSYTLASYECKKFGGVLASIKTRMEQKDIAPRMRRGVTQQAALVSTGVGPPLSVSMKIICVMAGVSVHREMTNGCVTLAVLKAVCVKAILSSALYRLLRSIFQAFVTWMLQALE